MQEPLAKLIITFISKFFIKIFKKVNFLHFFLCSLVFICQIVCYVVNLSMPKGNLLLKDGKEAFYMTQSDLILRLIEMLLNEKDKSINQSKAKETKPEKN